MPEIPAVTKDPRFLQAVGYGQTPSEARNAARAELASIFSARIESDQASKVSSRRVDDEETVSIHARQQVRVSASAELEGVTISEPVRSGSMEWRSVARLDRSDARARWSRSLATTRHQLADLKARYHKEPRPLLKIPILNSAIFVCKRKRSLQSRLRVIGFPDAPSPHDGEMAWWTATRADLANRLIFAVEASGPSALPLQSEIARALQESGFRVHDTTASARILVSSVVEPVPLDNPGWVFARATGHLKVIDSRTGTQTFEVRKSARMAKTRHEKRKRGGKCANGPNPRRGPVRPS